MVRCAYCPWPGILPPCHRKVTLSLWNVHQTVTSVRIGSVDGKGERVERRSITHQAESTEPRREAPVYRKILVALDGSDAARAAFVFASDWARHFDSELWFIQLTQE